MQGSGRCFGHTAITAAEISRPLFAIRRSSPYTEEPSVYQDGGGRGTTSENGNWFSEKIVLKQHDERIT